jgi:hypothetical protein
MQILDPRQGLATTYYTDPSSPTFANVKGSMIRAGYGAGYADSIHGDKPQWLTDVIQDTVEMVRSAERNLKRFATMTINVNDKNAIDWARLQVDVSKYITKTLASKKYSENKEVETPNVQINIVNYGEKPIETVEPTEAEVK